MARCTLTLLVFSSAAALLRLPLRMKDRNTSSFFRVSSSSICMVGRSSRWPSIMTQSNPQSGSPSRFWPPSTHACAARIRLTRRSLTPNVRQWPTPAAETSPMRDEQTLTPGMMVVHGNRLEELRELAVAWMQRHPLAPLENEVVLVQSNGIAQCLKLALAEQSGCGIAAAIQLELPARFLWQSYRAVLGSDEIPQQSPLDKAPLTWRLVRLLPALLQDQAFAPLRRFLADDADLRKRHQLAERLADLFDQYQVYRADWLADWAEGRDQLRTSRDGARPLDESVRWQPALWRALLEDVGAEQLAGSRAGVHPRFVERLRQL